MPETATVVAVHGAWSGSWMWWKVEPLVREAGAPFVAVDLPTCSAADTSIGILDDVRHVTGVVDDVDGPVVLVGNSYGGAVLSGVLHESVVRLVYLAAHMPDAGEPIIGVMSGNARPEYQDAVSILDDGRMRLDAEVVARCAVQQATDADREVFRARLGEAMSMGTDFAISFDRVSWREVPSTYVVCTDDRSLDPETQRTWAKERATDPIEWPFDHCPQVSHPTEVAELLIRLARSRA